MNNITDARFVGIDWVKVSRVQKVKPGSLWKKSSDGKLKLLDLPEDYRRIKIRIKKNALLGPQKLWEGYNEEDATRPPTLVSSQVYTGKFFTTLTAMVKPSTVIEFGTAFGVSGMYWLAGLKHVKNGHLYTFEINEVWAKIAEQNLKVISNRFTLTNGLFEDFVDETLGSKKASIAFIDGVHTSEWVKPQFDIVYKKMKSGGIILLDDITFSDDMRDCWKDLSADHRAKSAAVVNRRIGLIIV